MTNEGLVAECLRVDVSVYVPCKSPMRHIIYSVFKCKIYEPFFVP